MAKTPLGGLSLLPSKAQSSLDGWVTKMPPKLPQKQTVMEKERHDVSSGQNLGNVPDTVVAAEMPASFRTKIDEFVKQSLSDPVYRQSMRQEAGQQMLLDTVDAIDAQILAALSARDADKYGEAIYEAVTSTVITYLADCEESDACQSSPSQSSPSQIEPTASDDSIAAPSSSPPMAALTEELVGALHESIGSLLTDSQRMLESNFKAYGVPDCAALIRYIQSEALSRTLSTLKKQSSPSQIEPTASDDSIAAPSSSPPMATLTEELVGALHESIGSLLTDSQRMLESNFNAYGVPDCATLIRHIQSEALSRTLLTLKKQSPSKEPVDILRQMFPNGYERIPTSGQGLQCGLRAVIHSLKSQYPSVQPPSLEVLRSFQSSAYVQEFSRVVGQSHANDDNFHIDQLAAYLGEWGRDSKRGGFQLGYVLSGGTPFLVPSPEADRDDVSVVWIHSTSVSGISDYQMDHFEGLRARLARDETIVDMSERCDAVIVDVSEGRDEVLVDAFEARDEAIEECRATNEEVEKLLESVEDYLDTAIMAYFGDQTAIEFTDRSELFQALFEDACSTFLIDPHTEKVQKLVEDMISPYFVSEANAVTEDAENDEDASNQVGSLDDLPKALRRKLRQAVSSFVDQRQNRDT
ncbi:hypothetical protein K4K59_006582 [Colletotrichum sp. SAR11_240]|nr:hypothetical protein K4K59_006582 [Colletotrichum sp. SAR11_240]